MYGVCLLNDHTVEQVGGFNVRLDATIESCITCLNTQEIELVVNTYGCKHLKLE